MRAAPVRRVAQPPTLGLSRRASAAPFPDAADAARVHVDLAGHGRRRFQLVSNHVAQSRGEASGRVPVHTPTNSAARASEAHGGMPGMIATYYGTLAQWRCHGTGPCYVRFGHRVLYRGADLNAWLDARVVETAPLDKPAELP